MAAMVVLSFLVVARLFFMRFSMVRSGEADPRYFKTYQDGSEPERAAQLARHFANLFESPVLFYAGCLAAMFTGLSGTTIVTVAWVYVALRLCHAFIHTGANQLYPRIFFYFSSWVALLTLWGLIVVRVSPGL